MSSRRGCHREVGSAMRFVSDGVCKQHVVIHVKNGALTYEGRTGREGLRFDLQNQIPNGCRASVGRPGGQMTAAAQSVVTRECTVTGTTVGRPASSRWRCEQAMAGAIYRGTRGVWHMGRRGCSEREKTHTYNLQVREIAAAAARHRAASGPHDAPAESDEDCEPRERERVE